MGIFIYAAVSKAVTAEEWAKVYEETLELAGKLPLADRRKKDCKGVETLCFAPVEERTVVSGGWYRNGERTGWFAEGDYDLVGDAETYFMPKNLVEDTEYNPEAGDALYGILNEDIVGEDLDTVYHIWGGKTQGEPYHIYLLGIACLMEARLGNKFIVYGDITRGQCRKAVELVNRYLDKPIDLPTSCDAHRLMKRVKAFPLTVTGQLSTFDEYYLGATDEEVGKAIRENFTEEECRIHWRDRFKGKKIGTGVFDSVLRDYLLAGFDLEELCAYIDDTDAEGTPDCDKFVERIMDAKLHIKEKNCEDMLETDKEEEQPYSIFSLLGRFVFGGCRNKKIDRFIPLEEIRGALKRGLEGKCNVDELIDNYLAKEAEEKEIILSDNPTEEEIKEACRQDASEVFRQGAERRYKAMREHETAYDITSFKDLLYYEKGDSVEPKLEEALADYVKFLKSLLEESEYARLMNKFVIERCEWLTGNNRHLLMRDIDWIKIYTDVENCEESFSRYYPLMRAKLDCKQLTDFGKAYAINDDFYAYCERLEKESAN